jgi:tetratricopeptide (TPR) repeat protein
MQTTARTIRFLTASSFDREPADSKNAASRSEMIQSVVLTRLAQALHTRQGLIELAGSLIQAAEHAYSLRDMNTVQQAGEILAGLPLDVAKQIGLYYQALSIKRDGQIDKAKRLLEIIADNAPFVYRGRAIQTLGRIHHEQGKLDEALRFYLEAVRITQKKRSCDPLVTLLAQSEISHIKSDLGDHRSALTILENISPLAQVVGRGNPFYYYTYHNELAFELAESGRLDEAQAASEVALASPFAPAYPEWAETREEIAAKRLSATPSVVFIALDLNIDATSQEQSQRTRALNCPAVEIIFSDNFTSVAMDVSASIATACLTPTILDRLGESIRPRAPPTSL